MENNIVIGIYILTLILELFSIYYVYRIDGISISFLGNFLLYYYFSIKNKFIDNTLLILAILVINILVFIIKEFLVNFNVPNYIRSFNLISKLLTLLLFFFITFLINLFNLFDSIFYTIIFILILLFHYVFLQRISYEKFLEVIKNKYKNSLNISDEDMVLLDEKIKFNINILPFSSIFLEVMFLSILIFLYSIFDKFTGFKYISFLLIIISCFLFIIIIRNLYNKKLFDLNYNLILEELKGYLEKEKFKKFELEKESILKENENLKRQLEAMYEFYSKIDVNYSLNDIYKKLHYSIEKSLSFSKLIIFLYDEEENCLVSVYGVNVGNKVLKYNIGEKAIGSCVKERQPIVYLGGTISSAMAIFMDDRSFIACPSIISDKIVGVIYIASSYSKAFTQNDIDFLQVLSNQFGVFYLYYKEYSKTLDLAIKDGLTGLYTHRYFQELLTQELEKAKNYSYPLTLLMIDTDKFKQYNDTFGHPEGDKLLKNIANILTKNVRKNDYVCRYGGDEFAIILVNTKKQDAYYIAERIRQSYSSLKKGDIQVSASIGIASYPDDAITKDDLIKKADTALYEAKKTGRNKVVFA
ncbi:MAG: sensor domain-containing diguanylate cyclase [bacterium]|nr:sensor domain-containing diguanylate cyclase [bacterium]